MWSRGSLQATQPCEWRLGRCSQGRGILVRKTSLSPTTASENQNATSLRAAGRSQLVPGSSCGLLGNTLVWHVRHTPWYYILDSEVEGGLDTVQDGWVPWKGW